jgi:hypothetical protein
MSDWKKRWVELIGNDVAQFEAWQAHWLTLHPDDAPPDTVSDDDFVEELLQNWDKYLADPEVKELYRNNANISNLDNARRAHEERMRGAKLREDLGYVGVCVTCEQAVYRTLDADGRQYVWQCDSLSCGRREITASPSARPHWVRPTHDSIPTD